MVRRARVVVPGQPHHITQRGNNKQDVFFTDEDRHYYLRILKEQSKKYGLQIEGYCLMTNHVHIVATPDDEKSLSKAIGRVHTLYTQYVNNFHNRSGHLWQNRFYSCVLDEDHFRESLRYVEMNPVYAGIVKRPWDYEWSSCKAHTGETESEILEIKNWNKRVLISEWKEYLLEKVSESQIKKMETYIRTGRPLGSDSFISKLETKLNKRLRPLPVGRPKKEKNTSQSINKK